MFHTVSSVVSLVTLIALVTFQPTESSGRGPFRGLTLVKKLASSPEYSDDVQLVSPDAIYGFDHTIPFVWRIARNPFHESLNYLTYLDHLVKKKSVNTEDEDENQELKRDGNRKFQTQGWRR
ncbi:uncharacterized protein LOC143239010 [Tachypleus tridentatus]|uniref:uncharacterized protein LOC143239010 n=1 Tax=Tachypleus tridentatus TaxID=6853 RepID=UPI003FD4157F